MNEIKVEIREAGTLIHIGGTEMVLNIKNKGGIQLWVKIITSRERAKSLKKNY